MDASMGNVDTASIFCNLIKLLLNKMLCKQFDLNLENNHLNGTIER